LVFVLVRKVYLIERLARLVEVYLYPETAWVIILKAAIRLIKINGLLKMLRVFSL